MSDGRKKNPVPAEPALVLPIVGYQYPFGWPEFDQPPKDVGCPTWVDYYFVVGHDRLAHDPPEGDFFGI
jgi:hypothetical protein